MRSGSDSDPQTSQRNSRGGLLGCVLTTLLRPKQLLAQQPEQQSQNPIADNITCPRIYSQKRLHTSSLYHGRLSTTPSTTSSTPNRSLRSNRPYHTIRATTPNKAIEQSLYYPLSLALALSIAKSASTYLSLLLPQPPTISTFSPTSPSSWPPTFAASLV